jgi:broad specificity phosphatase PhoE
MKIYLARHGLTNYNELGLCNSHPSTDVHLSRVGLIQADDLAEKLKKAKIDQIFVSELKRTQQTSNIINRYHDAPIQVDPRLNDNLTGYEGKPVKDYYAALAASEHKWTARLNGGESLEDVKERTQSFIKDLGTKRVVMNPS